VPLPRPLVDLVAAVMQGAGSSNAEARTIATRLVDSNLVGHDSHGVLRVGKYLEWMRSGWLKANQAPTIVFESDAIAIVDGNRGFGQVVGEFAGSLGTPKAAKNGNRDDRFAQLRASRPGWRLGRALPPLQVRCRRHFLNTSNGLRVAPFGGGDRRLSTNPITIGVPVAGSDPVIMDMTTSMVAEGKLIVAVNRDERVPEGWIIDKDGRPTTEPKDFYDGGALLTVGGHKGSGLSIVTDLRGAIRQAARQPDPC
jgi:uncharacterized oxidoreductase